MATVQVPVSDMLVTVKAREVQRGMLVESRGDRSGTTRHFLAAGHLFRLPPQEEGEPILHTTCITSVIANAVRSTIAMH